MASKNKVAKLKNSYCLPGMLKNKATELKLKRTAFYTSADRRELNNEVKKIFEDEYDEEQQFDYKVEKNELLKRLENEWKIIYPICKKYESLLPNYNRNFPNKKLQTFKERTGKILIENKTKYFNYQE